MNRRLSAAEALKHPWITKFVPPMDHEVQGNETAQNLIQLLENASRLTKFQFINLLIMVELLSLADHQFVTDAKSIFIAVN
jgi:hypothetical protein